MKNEKLLSKLEKCKTVKSARTLLNKNHVSYEELIDGRSISIKLNDVSYTIIKHRGDSFVTVNAIRKVTRKFEGRIVPSCYGHMVIL